VCLRNRLFGASPPRNYHVRPLRFLIAALVAAAVAPSPLAAQPAETSRYEISSVTFEGLKSFNTNELRTLMATRETPGAFNKFLYNTISERLGRQDEYFNAVTLGADVERLRKFYRNHGFSEVLIDTLLPLSGEDGMMNITIRITEGYRSLIEQVVYRGIVDVPVTIWEDLRRSPNISPGDPYSSQLLEDEVKRILRLYANNGFPNAEFVRDSSYARRYASSRNYVVKLMFDPGHRYVFGGITVQQEVDTLNAESPRDDISEEIILRQMDYQPGEFFSLEKKISSERSLNRLGIFDLRSLDIFVPPRTDSAISIPSRVTIRPRDKHELAPELLVSDKDGAFNLGAGLGYTNRNFLGGARTFNARLRFQTQTIGNFPDYFRVNEDAVSNLDLTFEVVQPYIFTNKIKGTWSFSFILDKQKPYLQNILRNKFGFAGQQAEFTTSVLEWTLEAVDLQKNENFAASDPSVQRQLGYLQERQFNSILSFTMARDMTNDLFSPSAGFIHAVTVEEAGMLPLALTGLLPDLPYTQFVRGILVGRWYSDASERRFLILASKLKAGIEEKYGASRGDSSRTIPQTHRFFGGGGGSVRGWASRDLKARGDPQLGGNFLLEASVECRVNIFQTMRDGFFDKSWLVGFVDVGNVWEDVNNFQFKSVAIATGIGVRWETLFGPFRLDWGIRVFDPTRAEGNQWITQRQLLGETFAEGVFHFGIGHAF